MITVTSPQALTERLGGEWNSDEESGLACCPAHDDHSPSLVISEGETVEVALHCRSGCSFPQIVEALRRKDINLNPPLSLTLEQYAEGKGLSESFLRNHGLSDSGSTACRSVAIPYFDLAGKVAAVRYRRSLRKVILKGQDRRFVWRKGDKPILYGLDRLAHVAGDEITLVEGESDCHTLWFHDIAAIGLPGAAMWREERDALHLERFTTIYVVIEPDTGGARLKDRLAKSSIRDRIRLVTLPVKDASELHLADEGAFVERWRAAVAAATPWQDPPDPLEDLVERTQADPGHPFKPEVLRALAALRSDDPAAFESLRAQLKAAKCPIMRLDKALKEVAGGEERKPSMADALVRLALENCTLFHTADKVTFAEMRIDEHRESWLINSEDCRLWLAQMFYRTAGSVASNDALRSAVTTLAAEARSGPEMPLFVRVAGHDESIYLDLGTPDWSAIEITKAGWRLVADPPVHFRRSSGMLPLPLPTRGGSIKALRPFVNIDAEQDFVLVVAWVLATLRPRGPYPVLGVTGDHGSAKSSLLRRLRALVDPRVPALRSLPSSDRDCFIAAGTQHLLVFDNVRNIKPWLSDVFCRIATGGGHATRTLYTDADETRFDVQRPIALNGIKDMIESPDLADRALLIHLKRIEKERCRTDNELDADFESVRPAILGALLDAVSFGLRTLPSLRFANPPRMADFATWAAACEGAVWSAGTFEEAYRGNLRDAIETVLAGDVVATTLQAFMSGLSSWEGSPSTLLAELTEEAGDQVRKSPQWPRLPNVLSGRLREAASFLREVGIVITTSRDKSSRKITITNAAKTTNGAGDDLDDDRRFSSSSTSSPSSSPSSERLHDTGNGAPPAGTEPLEEWIE
jgi:hypothetical protein